MDPIAITGMACLFPGAISPEAFWQILCEGRDTTSAATRAKMGVDPQLLYDPAKGRRDRFYALRGGFVTDVAFDPTGYVLPAHQLAGLDDLHAWSLMVVRQALFDSGVLHDAAALARCGLVLGNLSFPTLASHRLLAPIYRHAVEAVLAELNGGRPVPLEPDGEASPGSTDAVRIAGYPAALAVRALGLEGPWLALDAACASSLYAIRLACDYLAAGKADLMVAGAVSCADPVFIHMGFSIFQAYPEQGGASKPLDRSSRGLTSGEGAGALVLKRYGDALRDGDRVYAVIRGIGWSNDGAGRHVLVPNPKGQLLAYERAYKAARLAPDRVASIECHATGTPVGDATELQTVETFFGAHGQIPLLGSVKSNFGHLLTAAGMAGTIKTVLSINHGIIPATIHVEQPLASPSGAVGPRQIVRALTPWPENAPRCAAVSAFGFGGTNAHLVLEHPSITPPPLARTLAHEARERFGEPREREDAKGANQTIANPQTVVRPHVGGPLPGEEATATPTLAIVGMDACLGPWRSLAAIEGGIVSGARAFRPLPVARWKGCEANADLLRWFGIEGGTAPHGAYVDHFTLDSLRFKIPPAAGDQPIPQQLLILHVADRALHDAGVRPGGNVAVLVAMEAELALHQFRARVDLSWQLPRALEQAGLALSPDELARFESLVKDSLHDPAQVNQYTSFIGNLMACRIAALWDFNGPAFTVSAEEGGCFRALELAQLLLAEETVEAVVVGAVDLAGGVERVLVNGRAGLLAGASTAPGHDQEAEGWLVGEGAGALVIKRQADTAEDRVYATLEAVSLARLTTSHQAREPAAIAHAAQTALHTARVAPDQIGYLELWASGFAAEDDAELAGLAQIYRQPSALGPQPSALSCAVGSMKANLGHAGVAAGIAGVIRAALSLSRRMLPATPGWLGPRRPEVWATTSFFVPDETRPWFAPRAVRRLAAVSGLSSDGACAHVILGEAPAAVAASRPAAQPPTGDAWPAGRAVCLSGSGQPALFPLVAPDVAGLRAQLESLAHELRQDTPLSALSQTRLAHCRATPEAPLAMTIIAATHDELRRELSLAHTGLDEALHTGHPWETPGGSFFAPQPLGSRGAIAFVYPGAFTSYPGLGRGLMLGFPELHDLLASLTTHPALAVAEGQLFPRGQYRADAATVETHTAQLRTDVHAMIAAGTSFAILYTALLREHFGVQPTMAFGYSMGESTMHWALGLWRDLDLGLQRLGTSPSFRERLVGRRTAARDFLGTGPEAPADFWQVYVVRAPAERVRERMHGERRAFLTHINTPNEVVIAGAREALSPILADLGGDQFRAPFDTVIHCPPAQVEYEALAALHYLPTTPVTDVRRYTAAGYGPAPFTSEEIAHTLARTITQPVDFPRLVERAYAAGARIFIEAGPGTSCTRWISEILRGHEHLALAVNRRGSNDDTTMLQVLARLVAHRVPLDLSPLLAPPTNAPAPRLPRLVTVGGERVSAKIVSDEHRGLFMRTRRHEPMHLGGSPHALGGSPHALGGSPHASYRDAPLRSPAAEHHAALLEERRSRLEHLRVEVTTALQAVREPPQLSQLPQSSVGAVVVGSEVASLDKPRPIWNEADLLEFARGSIARVFGPEYAVIDSYARRVRLPTPPYLLVSRVTHLDARRGSFTPCSITTEYDLPQNAWYCIDGQAPWAVSVESGQCDLLLISYLGIDFQCRGERVYRLLDCTLTFLDELPKEGETLRYDIKINSFARSGETLLFFFSYECFVGERMVLRMDGGCAGFFSDAELAHGRGVVDTDNELTRRRTAVRQRFTPPLTCERTSLSKADLLNLSAGKVADCFGPAYNQGGRNPSLRLPPPDLLMIDQIVSIDPRGGAWGLGLMVAEKELDPEGWYFPCHFQDDPVLAGSLMAEGCGQLLQSYMLLLGLQAHTFDARFQPIPGLPQEVRCRGQVTPTTRKLVYKMELTGLGLEPEPFAHANVDIVADDRIVVRFTNLGLRLLEKAPQPKRTAATLEPGDEVLINERQITAFATGSFVECFGPDYAIFEHRRAPRTPNGALQLISRIVAVDGQRRVLRPGSSLVSEYDVPVSPWFCRENSYPETPYSVLMELGLQPCGFLSAWLGSTLPYPEHDFYFRNLDGSGDVLREVDLRGKTVRNHVTLRASTAIEGVIIQKFTYALECDGEPCFQGDAAFGYFTGEALARQVGLDGGRTTQTWLAQTQTGPDVVVPLNDPRHPLYQAPPGRVHERLPGGRFHLLDTAQVVSGGGREGLGYVHATRKVDPHDWFFACHFHQDPVMPGSLGVEAMLRAMQVLALHEGLGRPLHAPRLGLPARNKCVWKYRGQIAPTAGTMELEVHIVRREQQGNGLVLVGEGSLWRDGLRIYEVRGLALLIADSRLPGA